MKKLEYLFTLIAILVSVHIGAKVVVMSIDRASQWDSIPTESMIEVRELYPEEFHCWDCWIESGNP